MTVTPRVADPVHRGRPASDDVDTLPGIDDQLMAADVGVVDAYARRLVATRTYTDRRTGALIRMDLADARAEVAALVQDLTETAPDPDPVDLEPFATQELPDADPD